MFWTMGHTIGDTKPFRRDQDFLFVACEKQFVQDPFEQIGGSFAAVDGKLKKNGDPTKRIFD